MDELHTEINNLKAVKRDSKSLTHFATTIACYVSDMEDNIGCPVLESVEAPFLMSQLLSKLDPSDNSDFGREMKREGKEETASNLITQLHQGASIRSRGKANTNAVERNEIRRDKGSKKTENNATNSEDSDEETCPLGFHQRWECLRVHHTNEKKSDGSTCDKCKKKTPPVPT